MSHEWLAMAHDLIMFFSCLLKKKASQIELGNSQRTKRKKPFLNNRHFVSETKSYSIGPAHVELHNRLVHVRSLSMVEMDFFHFGKHRIHTPTKLSEIRQTMGIQMWIVPGM